MRLSIKRPRPERRFGRRLNERSLSIAHNRVMPEANRPRVQ